MGYSARLSATEIESKRAVLYKRITEYGIGIDTIREAVVCDAALVEDAINTGKLPSSSSQYDKLANVLGWLSETMLPYIEDSVEHLRSLICALETVNGVSKSSIAAYLNIEGVDAAAIDRAIWSNVRGEPLSALPIEQEYKLFRVASLLNDILNKNEPWPWA